MTRHKWKKVAGGNWDSSAVYTIKDGMIHNGYLCTECGFSFCVPCSRSVEINEWHSFCPTKETVYECLNTSGS